LELTTPLGDDVHHGGGQPLTRRGWKTDEDHSARSCASGEDKLAEVAILRDEDPVVGDGHRQDLLVGQSRRDFNHGSDVVARAAESAYHAKVAAFIGEKTHSVMWFEDRGLFVRDRVGGVGRGSPNVLDREVRVRLEQLLLGRAFSKLSQDELDSDARASNDRFSKHDLGIDLNAWFRTHGVSS
jgi:hypothetical protein